MMTLTHGGFDTLMYCGLDYFGVITFRYHDLLVLYSASLIDLDHLFSKPIFDPKRNPFKTHFLHKNWKVVILFSLVVLFFYRPLAFLGLGLLSHLLLDLIYIKRHHL